MKPEIRSYVCELRAVGEPAIGDDTELALEGVAASYDVLSQDLGGFRERIAPGAFARSLREGRDVTCLLNHDPNHVLGRLKSGTLNIFDVAKGLGFRCQLDPNNSQHQNVHAMVKRGDINQCSFAFTVPDGGDEWDEAADENGKFTRRTLRNVNLRDVSVVTYPAYDAQGSTSVGARAASDAAVDAYNRRRAAKIAQEIAADSDADFQRRLEAAHRAVAEDRARGDI